VLLVLASQLGNLVDHVGGAGHYHVLLEPLEALMGVEERPVRESALNSVRAIVARMSSEAVQAKALPMLVRMSDGGWVTTRISACALHPVL
jgi:hypothetical protein